MTPYLIHPHDPLVFGDGRPNTAIEGSVARSRALPPPPALAGAVRGALGKDAQGRFGGGASADALQDLADWLSEVPVHGPLLWTCGGWAFPAPADALHVGPKQRQALRWRRPVRPPPGAQARDHGLHPIATRCLTPGKPWHQPAPFWRWTELEPWLSQPAPEDISLHQLCWGIGAPQPELRTHVVIEPGAGTARLGGLYGTEGRRWTVSLGDCGVSADLALGFALGPLPGRPAPGLAVRGLPEAMMHPLGGERRFAAWRASPTPWPALPPAIAEAITSLGFARLVLATPAWFEGGASPRRDTPFGLPGARLLGQINGPPEVVSGWSLRRRGQKPGPKPTRRLVPAGATFFLDLREVSPEARRAWVERTWLQPVSEDEASRRDGLGLALPGAWDGELSPMFPSEQDRNPA